jgi:hypothetical protein
MTNSNPMVLDHVTVTDNTTARRSSDNVAGNLGFFGSATVHNSIVTGGAPTNCRVPVTSQGGNLESANDCGFGTGDLIDTDPGLASLLPNGGLARTQALLPGSHAFGLATAPCAATDQRGAPRPQGGSCDSGAFESAEIPANSASPTIAGAGVIGSNLSCDPGTWSNAPSLAFGWLRNGVEITGETAASYTTGAADADAAVQCRVVATNEAGSVSATSAPLVVAGPKAPTAPSNTTAPQVTGKTRVGKKVTCETGTWSGSPTFAFAWLRNGKAISGENATQYKTAKKDGGKALQCRVTATAFGLATVADSPPVVVRRKHKR